MKKLQKVLCLGMLSLAFAGCNETKPHFLEGKVLEEKGRVVGVESTLFKGDTSNFGNIGSDDYNLVVQTSSGEYILNVYSDTFGKSLGSLSEEIEVGGQIKFQTNYRGIENFGYSKKGSVQSDAIEIIKD